MDAWLQPLLMHGLKGIEKEGLRMTREGTISLSPHPAALGSALTHPEYYDRLLRSVAGVDHARIVGRKRNARVPDGFASIRLCQHP